MIFDELLEQVGSFGRYQRFLFCVVALAGFPAAFNNMGIVFLAATPNHWCDVSMIGEQLNLTGDALKNLTIPLEKRKGKMQHSQCQMYDLNYTTMSSSDVIAVMTSSDRSGLPLKGCEKWQYDRSVYQSSIVTQVRRNYKC